MRPLRSELLCAELVFDRWDAESMKIHDSHPEILREKICSIEFNQEEIYRCIIIDKTCYLFLSSFYQWPFLKIHIIKEKINSCAQINLVVIYCNLFFTVTPSHFLLISVKLSFCFRNDWARATQIISGPENFHISSHIKETTSVWRPLSWKVQSKWFP